MKFPHPLSRLQGDVGPHAPGDARGPCTNLLCRPWKDKNWVKTNLKTKEVGLTLDHPLQVELELDLLAGVDDEGELEDDGEEEAQPCQRPKRPHQNFTLNPSNAVQASEKQIFNYYNWPTITESEEKSF